MQIAILLTSTIAAAASVGALAIVGKMAYEMNNAKTQLEAEMETIKQKVARNAKVVKATLSQIEL